MCRIVLILSPNAPAPAPGLPHYPVEPKLGSEQLVSVKAVSGCCQSKLSTPSIDLVLSVKTKCQSKKSFATRDLSVKAVSQIFPPAVGCQWTRVSGGCQSFTIQLQKYGVVRELGRTQHAPNAVFGGSRTLSLTEGPYIFTLDSGK